MSRSPLTQGAGVSPLSLSLSARPFILLLCFLSLFPRPTYPCTLPTLSHRCLPSFWPFGSPLMCLSLSAHSADSQLSAFRPPLFLLVLSSLFHTFIRRTMVVWVRFGGFWIFTIFRKFFCNFWDFSRFFRISVNFKKKNFDFSGFFLDFQNFFPVSKIQKLLKNFIFQFLVDFFLKIWKFYFFHIFPWFFRIFKIINSPSFCNFSHFPIDKNSASPSFFRHPLCVSTPSHTISPRAS